MNYSEASDYIRSYTGSGRAVTDLSRFTALMQTLGNPQSRLRFVHVAGTNGKGSICEYISRGLQLGGFKTGCFTSPYIVRQEERIRLNGESVDDGRFAEICGRVSDAVSKSGLDGLSQFEIFTAIAFIYYAEEGCDYVVLETGIGGTLDCTNIITPVLSVIATIDYDHCAILGSTLAEIASHKAGIIKRGVPCVISGGQHAEAFAVVAERAERLNAPLIIAEGAAVTSSNLGGNRFTYNGVAYRTAMRGEYQTGNATTAIEAMRLLGLNGADISEALATAVIPARLQTVGNEPLVIIDGGHNPSGFASAMEAVLREGREITLLTGCLKTKSLTDSYKKYLPLVSAAVFVDFFSADAVSAETLSELARESGTPCAVAGSAVEAAEKSRSYCEKNGIILAAGSLYLAGALLRERVFE